MSFVRTLEGNAPALPVAPSREGPDLRKDREWHRGPAVVCRADGDRYLLVEYGPNVLDLNLRFRRTCARERMRGAELPGILDITPGVRSAAHSLRHASTASRGVAR